MKTFCKGLQCYISQHKYGNTVTEDLWSALEKASGKPIEQIMSTWTKQTGFPVITVRAGVFTPEGYTITVEQTRFLADGNVDGMHLFVLFLILSTVSKDQLTSTVIKIVFSWGFIANCKCNEKRLLMASLFSLKLCSIL